MGFPFGTGLLKNLVNPSRIEYGIASSIVAGAFCLVDPARLGPRSRWAFRGLTAGIVGGLTLLELKRTPALKHNPIAIGGAAAGVAGTVFGLSEVSENLDARMMSGLERVGIRSPRVFVAVVSTVASIVSFRSSVATEEDADSGSADGPFYTDVDPAVRALVDGMLAETPEHSSATLSAQWATARTEHWTRPEPGEFDRWLEFSVEESTSRVVPHTFTFPVKAHFRTPSGVVAEASLLVSEGRLRSLAIDVAPGADELESFDDGDPIESLSSWPALEDVTFVLDTP